VDLGLKDKVVLVTGGSLGTGQAATVAFAVECLLPSFSPSPLEQMICP
jgi:UDP-N-acetylglucosamine:LPS N-acetylglucosamine transferase